MAELYFNVRVHEASAWEREAIEALTRPLASDACVIITYRGQQIGWGDDYGTFHPLGTLREGVNEPAEALLGALNDLAATIE